MRYWKITGLNEGKEIKPFYVKSHSIPHDYLDVYGDAYLDVYGDASRQFEEVCKDEFIHGSRTLYYEQRMESLEYLHELGIYTLEEYIEGLKELVYHALSANLLEEEE